MGGCGRFVRGYGWVWVRRPVQSRGRTTDEGELVDATGPRTSIEWLLGAHVHVKGRPSVELADRIERVGHLGNVA